MRLSPIRQVISSQVPDLSQLSEKELVVWDFLQERGYQEGKRVNGWILESFQPITRSLYIEGNGSPIRKGILLVFLTKHDDVRVRADFIIKKDKVISQAYARPGRNNPNVLVENTEAPTVKHGWHTIQRVEYADKTIQHRLKEYQKILDDIAGSAKAKWITYNTNLDASYYELLQEASDVLGVDMEELDGMSRLDLIESIYSGCNFRYWVGEYEWYKEEGIL